MFFFESVRIMTAAAILVAEFHRPQKKKKKMLPLKYATGPRWDFNGSDRTAKKTMLSFSDNRKIQPYLDTEFV